ncbi:Demethylrebeccamycin-D-glucose O-methyltransferase [invertebrate metagenome]|uniref:Demethylrebeccamycin-D-glucose O-methyltransferase n=1 Tax=invertebrate metagenome TaxID=1711999 RepID=A0A2H9TA46_9ZZZZ
MNDFELLIRLHIHQHRQGPGGIEETLQAARLAGLDNQNPLKIADVGCGTGAAAMDLAKSLNSTIHAVDFLPEFIDELKNRIESEHLDQKILATVGNMEDLPFEEASFDVLWSEGAVYNMGFEKGIGEWRKFLKPSGKLVVSELTWLTYHRPEAITEHWEREYPEVATAAEKIAQLEKHGYKLLGYFPLREHCWTDNYYQPLQQRFESFVAECGDQSASALSIVEEHKKEIQLYTQFKDFFSYGVYVAEKVESKAV